MRNKIFRIIFFAVAFLTLPNFTKANVIFEDNFDSQLDWYPNCIVCGQTDGVASGGYGGAMPIGWQYFRNDEYWNKYMTVPYGSYVAEPNAEPTIQIKGGAPYTNSGKAFIVHNESESDSPNGGGSGWSSDGILAYISPLDYQTIYTQFKIKYQPNFQRYWPLNGAASIKTFRFEHFDRTGSPFYNGAPGNVAPSFLLQTGQNAYGEAMVSDSARCDPQRDTYVNYDGSSYRLPFRYAYPVYPGAASPPTAPWQLIAYNSSYPQWDNATTYTASNYWCDQMVTIPVTKSYFTVSPPACTQVSGYSTLSSGVTAETLGIFDGNWHTITLHAELNTAIGNNNGIYEVIYDGCTLKYLNNVGWIGVNGDINAGWNAFMLGGNVFNNYLNITDGVYRSEAEQWYAIDDVIVSTTPIPADYVIGGIDTVAPNAPNGLSVI